MKYWCRGKIAGMDPLAERIEAYADETRLHYSGGLSEDLGGPEESFEAE